MESEIAATPVRARLRLSDSLRQDAKGAAKTAVELLGVAASMTQNVPYLGIISGVLIELLKMQDEAENFKSDWKATMSVTQQVKSIVDRVRAQTEELGTGDDALPQGFHEPLTELERCIAKSLETLNACKAGSKRLRDRARVYINRTELSGNAKQCRIDMQAALDLFNTKLHIINTFTMQAQSKKLDMILTGGLAAPSDPDTSRVHSPLPPPPAIFHGRAQDVDHIVNLILDKPPARVAILGSGGIGKTSIALAVLHRSELEELYGDGRFFMSCEAVTSVEGILRELLTMFGLVPNAQSRSTPRALFLSHIRALPRGILCLDNLETPWDADTLGVESLLADITSLPHFALLVTTRGGDRPQRVAWTRPFLAHITSLTFEAALETWDAICDSHDAYTERLIKAVDLVPLAVTLLAQLALTESSEVLWGRWALEQTSLLQTSRGSEHRLNSVERSVGLSLSSPMLRDNTVALNFFSVLCTLPQGLPEARIPALVDAYAIRLPNLRRSIALLKQCSLVYSSEDDFLRVLSPIRHYMQVHHPVSSALFSHLSDVYCTLVISKPGTWGPDVAYSKKFVQPELVNISTILELSLVQEAHRLDHILSAIDSFAWLSSVLSIYDTTLLSKAITHAQRAAPANTALIWEKFGNALRFGERFEEAFSALFKALELSRLAGDKVAEANVLMCLGELYKARYRHDESESTLRQALGLYQELDLTLGTANTLQCLGDLLFYRKRYDEAERALETARDLYEQIDSTRGKADVMSTLGPLHRYHGRYDEAEHALETAHNLHDEIGYSLGKANDMYELGMLFIDSRRLEDAAEPLQSALNLYRDLNSIQGQVNSWCALGDLYMHRNHYDEAARAYAMGLDMDPDHRFRMTDALCQLGQAYVHLARFDDAERSLESALDMYRKKNDHTGEADALFHLGCLYWEQHQYIEAINAFGSARDISARSGNVLAQGKALRHLGLVHQDRAEFDTAHSCLADALRLFEEVQSSKNTSLIEADLETLRLKRHFLNQENGMSQSDVHPSSLPTELEMASESQRPSSDPQTRVSVDVEEDA
ncbi:hypothetical protein PENSPDRAFT_694758 [Peniophora sp. CONT]|nr:hypothetical protein PENSPDRAFT_694758 [Peniophora sp. CONT]